MGPMGVSRDQVALEWLKQPGNYERFVLAGGTAKRMGKAEETKHQVARLVCTLLQNAGFEAMNEHAVAIKLSILVKRFKQAHALAAVGGKLGIWDHHYHLSLADVMYMSMCSFTQTYLTCLPRLL